MELRNTLNENDVLCGRGKFALNYSGNKKFRELVNNFKLDYLSCPKKDKYKYATAIYNKIGNLNPPGRFLKQDDETSMWIDIGEIKSNEKIRQALREGAPGILPALKGSSVSVPRPPGFILERETPCQTEYVPPHPASSTASSGDVYFEPIPLGDSWSSVTSTDARVLMDMLCSEDPAQLPRMTAIFALPSVQHSLLPNNIASRSNKKTFTSAESLDITDFNQHDNTQPHVIDKYEISMSEEGVQNEELSEGNSIRLSYTRRFSDMDISDDKISLEGDIRLSFTRGFSDYMDSNNDEEISVEGDIRDRVMSDIGFIRSFCDMVRTSDEKASDADINNYAAQAVES